MTGPGQSGATTPTLLGNTAPIWVGLGAILFFRERLPIAFWYGLAIALAGSVLIVGSDSLRDISFGLGSLFGMLAGAFYGGYFLITQVGRRYLGALAYLWIVTLSAGLVLLLGCLVFDLPVSGYSMPTYLSFIALGLVSQVMGWLSVSYAQGSLPATLISPTMLAQPIVTAVLAAYLLQEVLTPWHLLGGGAVILGVFVVHRSRLKGAGRPT